MPGSKHLMYADCSTCFKYTAMTEVCSCNEEEANHLIRCWELVKIAQSKLRTRLYFKQEGELFCHVVFANNLEGVNLTAKQFYYLEGWQKRDSRRNCLIIYESRLADDQCV